MFKCVYRTRKSHVEVYFVLHGGVVSFPLVRGDYVVAVF